MENNPVIDILLDTGCWRTLVRQELVTGRRMLGTEVLAIRCAHGDIIEYPLARVQMQIGDKAFIVEDWEQTSQR